MSGYSSGPASAANAGTDLGNVSNISATKDSTKAERILRLLVGGARVTRFDVERDGDHYLNSTVAALGRRGVRISREPVTLQGRFGTVYCKQYWIEPKDRHEALRVLERLP
jgi:hypothetical protein